MTTKTEITNEMVAEALGFELKWYFRCAHNVCYWILPDGSTDTDSEWLTKEHADNALPDFTHDLNASGEHVWPVLVTWSSFKSPADEWLKDILWKAYNSPNSAMYFAIKLLELKTVKKE